MSPFSVSPDIIEVEPVPPELTWVYFNYLNILLEAVDNYFTTVRNKYNMKDNAPFSEETMNILEGITKEIKNGIV